MRRCNVGTGCAPSQSIDRPHPARESLRGERAGLTISRRLLVLVAIPLLGLLALGLYTRAQLLTLETRTRFVADRQLSNLTALAAIQRNITELRVVVRNRLLEEDASAQAQQRQAYD